MQQQKDPSPPPEVHHPVAPVQRKNTSGLAVTSLILGILSVFGLGFFLLPPLLAVLLGHIAVSNCNNDPNLDGKGMGIAGLVMGWLCLAGWILFVLFFGGLAILAGFLDTATP